MSIGCLISSFETCLYHIHCITDLMENLGSWWVFFPPVLYMFWVLASCLSWQRFLSLSVACLCTLLTASVVGFLISGNPSCQLGSFPVLLESFRKSSPILMSWRILSLSHEQFQCFGFYIKVSDPFWIDFCARWDVVLISSFVCVLSFPSTLCRRAICVPMGVFNFLKSSVAIAVRVYVWVNCCMSSCGFWPALLCVCHYGSVISFEVRGLHSSLCLGLLWPWEVFCVYKLILGLFPSSSSKSITGVLMGIGTHLQTALTNTTTSRGLILPIHEHGVVPLSGIVFVFFNYSMS